MRRKTKKVLPPRAKRMDRPARLQSARKWLASFGGKNVAKGYRRHFGVDWLCAFKELEMLGMIIDADYKSRTLQSVEGQVAARRRRESQRQTSDEFPLDQADYFTYIAGYTEAGFAYGITREEWELLEREDLLAPEVDSHNRLDDDFEIPF